MSTINNWVGMFVQQFVKYFALIKFSAIKARYWQPNYKILQDWNCFRGLWWLWWLLFRVYLLVYVFFSIRWVVSGVVHSLEKISNQSVLLLYFALAFRYVLFSSFTHFYQLCSAVFYNLGVGKKQQISSKYSVILKIGWNFRKVSFKSQIRVCII